METLPGRVERERVFRVLYLCYITLFPSTPQDALNYDSQPSQQRCWRLKWAAVFNNSFGCALDLSSGLRRASRFEADSVPKRPLLYVAPLALITSRA